MAERYFHYWMRIQMLQILRLQEKPWAFRNLIKKSERKTAGQ